MACNDIKVSISLQNIDLRSNRHRSYEAVGQRSHSLASAPALTEHRGCGFVITESVDWNEFASRQQSA